MTMWNPEEWAITANGAVKLTDDQVIEIIETRYKTTHRGMAEKHGISPETVRHIRAGRRRRGIWEMMREADDLL